jgi:ribosomal protein S18 acetylase RimI-like enzyme
MIQIMKAEEKHVPAIGELWWEFMLVHQQADPIYTPREGAVPSFVENHLRRFMKSEDGLALVALDGEKIVGYALAEILPPSPGFKRDKYGEIDQLAVTASHRRTGIGEMLLGEIMKWFQSNNIDRVELQNTAKNPLANSFWQKQGFEIYQYTRFKKIK